MEFVYEIQIMKLYFNDFR